MAVKAVVNWQSNPKNLQTLAGIRTLSTTKEASTTWANILLVIYLLNTIYILKLFSLILIKKEILEMNILFNIFLPNKKY